jgi:hypothetical protein
MMNEPWEFTTYAMANQKALRTSMPCHEIRRLGSVSRRTGSQPATHRGNAAVCMPAV